MYRLFEKRATACPGTSHEKDQYTEWEMRYIGQKRKKKKKNEFMRKETEI